MTNSTKGDGMNIAPITGYGAKGDGTNIALITGHGG
jgi:hypothetical protein